GVPDPGRRRGGGSHAGLLLDLLLSWLQVRRLRAVAGPHPPAWADAHRVPDPPDRREHDGRPRNEGARKTAGLSGFNLRRHKGKTMTTIKQLQKKLREAEREIGDMERSRDLLLR